MPTFDPIIYRTTDGTRWGPGKGSILTKTEWDNNWWNVGYRITLLESIVTPSGGGFELISIADFDVTGSQLTIIMTDYTTRGPYTLPTAQLNDRGDWQPSNLYLNQDLVRYAGALYIVIFNHVSDLTFDPDANNGMGDNYYSLLIAGPPNEVKTVTDHSYDLISRDAFTYIRFTNTGGCIIIISADSVLTFPTGTEIELLDACTSGSLTIEALSGVQLNVPEGFMAQSFGQFSRMKIKKVGPDEWDLDGRLAIHS